MLHVGLIIPGERILKGRELLTGEEMLMRLVRRVNRDAFFTTYAAYDGVVPEDPGECDCWIVSGSPCGVNDDHDWITALADFCRKAEGKTRLFGICFGHQIMARAFGGRVERSASGWNLGMDRYHTRPGDRRFDGTGSFLCYVIHRDLVVGLPDNAVEVFVDGNGDNGGLVYGDWAITVQCHPDFDAGYVTEAIADLHRSGDIGRDEYRAALKRLEDRPDCSAICREANRLLAGRV